MSYDFNLFRIAPGVDPVEAYEKHLEQEEARALEGMKPGPKFSQATDQLKQAAKRQLAEALKTQHPAFELFQEAHSEEDKDHPRYVELTDPESGLQVAVWDDGAGLTIPFWHGAEKAHAVLRAAWDCLQILESKGAFSIYDTQLGRILNLQSDFETTLNAYVGMTRTVKNFLGKSPED